MKYCLNCNKEICPPETSNSYLRSNFRLKKFCNEECRVEHNNKLKKKNYILKDTEHNIKVKELNKIIKGDICFVIGGKESYNPDLKKDIVDYELEIFRNMNHLKEKVRKWDVSRKHILVIAISDQTKELFDEVYFFMNNNLIREK